VVEQQDVLAAIKKFAGIKEAEGSRQLLTILTTAQLIFSESLIQLIVNNETQKEQFMVIRQSFTDWMRAELKNSSIGVDIKISETETQIKAYKPMDIFKAMSEKNPALLELKKRFDLEIDY
jgi:DNA polymerase-3 subunit gamma/tau